MKCRRSACKGFPLCALLLASLLSGLPVAAQPSRSSETQSRKGARVHFDRAIVLRDQERWAEALAEFLESRKQFMTLHGTTNAAACLVNLDRYVEALEMYEIAQRDFAEKLTADEKRDLFQVIKLLYSSVGTIEIVSSEPGATVQIDSLSRGELPFGAPLRVSQGSHTVRVVKEGYVPFEQRLDVAGGVTTQVTARLPRIQETDTPRRLTAQPLDASLRIEPVPADEGRGRRHPPHFLVEVGAVTPLLVSLGGDASTGCTAACSEPLGYGPGFVAHGGYDIADLSFGLSAGYLSMKQVVRGRSANVEVVGSVPHLVSVDDAVALRGVLLGAWVGYSLGETFRLHLRLGAGGLFGAVTDSRTSAPLSKDDGPWLGPFNQSSSASFFYVAPEVRTGLRLAKRIELTLGIEVPVLLPAPGPVWRQQVFTDTTSGSNSAAYAWFPDAPLTGPVVALLMPALGVRYDF